MAFYNRPEYQQASTETDPFWLMIGILLGCFVMIAVVSCWVILLKKNKDFRNTTTHKELERLKQWRFAKVLFILLYGLSAGTASFSLVIHPASSKAMILITLLIASFPVYHLFRKTMLYILDVR